MTDWRVELNQGLALARRAHEELPVSIGDRDVLKRAADQFPMMVTPSYSELIDWADPDDPLRKLLLPTTDEQESGGQVDTSGEFESTVAQGVQHKYAQTAVFLMNQACAGHCRYCFRRRLLVKDDYTNESVDDLDDAFAYVRNHPEIDNVLLSGGDPFIVSNRRFGRVIDALASIDHVRQLRISTKLPAFLPSRFTSDETLMGLLADASDRFQVVVQCHYDHPRELSEASLDALRALSDAGCVLTSQVALMPGINDDPGVLSELFHRMHYAGALPQYLFHPRPVKHAMHFKLPVLKGLGIVEAARSQMSGPVKRFRYVQTGSDGKLELVGALDNGQVVVRWQQLRMGLDARPTAVVAVNDDTAWIDL